MNYPDKPIFIIGSPRSGTTVLGSIMMQLDNFYFQPAVEGHFLYWFLEPTRRVLETPGKFPGATNSTTLAAQRNHPVLRQALAESVHHIYRKIGQESGDRNWVDKTPDLAQAQFIPFLTDLFPGSRVILIHRHPLEVFVSTTKNWKIEEPEKKRGILERWTQLQWTYRAQIVPHLDEDRRHVVRQENLLRRPDETVGKLLDFLGVPDRDVCQARIRRFLINNEVNRTSDFRGKGYDLKSRASEEDIALTREICGDEMRYWNYTL
jgi:hypothetical protein